MITKRSVGGGTRRAARRPRAPAASEPGALRRRAGVAAPVAPGGAAATATAQGRAGRGRGAVDEGRHRKLEVDAVERAVVAGVRCHRRGVPDVRQGHGAARRGPAAGDADGAGVAGEVDAGAAVRRGERGGLGAASAAVTRARVLQPGRAAGARSGASRAHPSPRCVRGERCAREPLFSGGGAGCRGRVAGLARSRAARRCGRLRLGVGSRRA